jgi:hypothetical protein
MTARMMMAAATAAIGIVAAMAARVQAACQSHTHTHTRRRARKRMGQDDAHQEHPHRDRALRETRLHMCTHTFIASLRFVFAFRVCVAHGSELLRYRSALGHFAATGLITCNCAPFQSRYVILNGYTLTRM